MRQILIVEDEMIIAHSTMIVLEELGYNVVGIASNKQETKEYIKKEKIDLVLLDINLGQSDEDGIDIATYLNEEKKSYVFVTSYSDKETLENALRTNPLGYIVKPVTRNILYTQLELVFKKINQSVINIKDSGNQYVLNIEDILYIQAEGNYCSLITNSRKIALRKSMKSIHKMLSSDFIQCHKAFILNLKKVRTINGNVVILNNKSILPISRHFKKNFIDI